MKWFSSLKSHFGEIISAWDSFWFTPTDPATLGIIRLLTGMLLFWTHLVWSFDLSAFLSAEGWVDASLRSAMNENRYAFSLFGLMGPTWLVWVFHILNLFAFFFLMIGLFSRTVAVWSFVAAISYANYVTPGAFFGLDKINCLLAMYVMLGPSGARYSIDSLLRKRRDQPPIESSIMANFALRLIQLHLCVVYLFSGLGKLQGELWRNGGATWYTVANVEYRSFNMTWLADHLWMVDLLTHVTVFWELFYCCVIWNRLARPWMLLTAVGMHGFIGLAMGMPEFALAMVVANMAFLAPDTIRKVFDPIARKLGG